ncbi:serine/threonine-protein kinase [Agromyces sp. Marseille-Q5079]|uniref:serine/threonine-protein kinase n=1 Tax=Agromyces sp. Marseille-Q5079 TaxID=3439059 RepID=UPI003D9C8DDF
MTDPIPADPVVDPPTRPRYDLLGHLGSGGMADVYRARDTELGREVAIKLFRDDDGTIADQQRREREIHLLGVLSHPGLVGVHDAGTMLHGGRPRRFIVMELVEGRSLEHRLARSPMKPRQVADLGAQLADTLSYVHSRSIVHRDVKPENVLLDETPALGYTLIAKLADFGVAQFVEGSRLTNDGAIMGTAAYISPEQARGEAVGPSSDVYSLGLVLLEALSGEREYTGTPIEAALARLHRPPAVPEELGDEWRDLLLAMTDDDPDARPSAHDVAATLRDIIRSMIIEGRGKRGHGGERRRAVGATRRAGANRTGRTAGALLTTGALRMTGSARARNENRTGRVAVVASSVAGVLIVVGALIVGMVAGVTAL